jgi:hypothetical protein
MLVVHMDILPDVYTISTCPKKRHSLLHRQRKFLISESNLEISKLKPTVKVCLFTRKLNMYMLLNDVRFER